MDRARVYAALISIYFSLRICPAAGAHCILSAAMDADAAALEYMPPKVG